MRIRLRVIAFVSVALNVIVKWMGVNCLLGLLCFLVDNLGKISMWRCLRMVDVCNTLISFSR